MIKQLVKAEAKRTEIESWKEVNSTHFRINVIVNGIGLSREIVERKDDQDYGSITEAEALAIVKKLKAKGFEAQLNKVQWNGKRIA